MCGLCCRTIGGVVAEARAAAATGDAHPVTLEVAAFPYSFTEEGACENLLPDNSCAVYDTRPDICSIQRTWEKHHRHTIDLETYQHIGEMSCQILQKQHNDSNNTRNI